MVNTAHLAHLFGDLLEPASLADLGPDDALAALREVNPAAADRLEGFAALPGWVEEGNIPITPEAIETTSCALLLAARMFGQQVKPPFVAPMPDGGIMLEWDGARGNELVVVVPPEGSEPRFLMEFRDASGGRTDWDGTLPSDAGFSELLAHLT